MSRFWMSFKKMCIRDSQYYFGDAYLFPQLEQYNYEIGCRVKESMQSFKIAVRAKKGTPKSTLKPVSYTHLVWRK